MPPETLKERNADGTIRLGFSPPTMWDVERLCKEWDDDSGAGQSQPGGQDVEERPKHPPWLCHWEGMGMHSSAFSTVSATSQSIQRLYLGHGLHPDPRVIPLSVETWEREEWRRRTFPLGQSGWERNLPPLALTAEAVGI